MASVDYYSEDVPACESEPEILESLPIIDTTTQNDDEQYDESDSGLVIEENSTGKLKKLNFDVELKIKDQLLFSLTNKQQKSGVKISSESKERNRLLKFTLLENELRALMLEIENDDESTNELFKGKVNTLVEDIDNFKSNNKNTFIDYWDSKLNELSITKPLTKDINIIKEPSTSSDTQFVEFETRIAKLESRISDGPLASNSPSIQKSIDDLYTRVNLILDNNNSLKPIEEEIMKLIENCETYIKDSKRIRDKSEIVPLTDRKLNLLYNKIKNLPEFNTLLDKVMIRFKSLNTLILETSTTVQFMKGLQKELTNMETHLDQWDDKLTQLESSLANDQQKFDDFTKLLKEK